MCKCVNMSIYLFVCLFIWLTNWLTNGSTRSTHWGTNKDISKQYECNSEFQRLLAHLELLTNSKTLRSISGRGLDSIHTHDSSVEGIGQSEDRQQRKQNGRGHGHSLILGNGHLRRLLEFLDVLQDDVFVADFNFLQLYEWLGQILDLPSRLWTSFHSWF